MGILQTHSSYTTEQKSYPVKSAQLIKLHHRNCYAGTYSYTLVIMLTERGGHYNLRRTVRHATRVTKYAFTTIAYLTDPYTDMNLWVSTLKASHGCSSESMILTYWILRHCNLRQYEP